MDKTILIVDDEASNIKILAEILKEWNLKVAKDGQTALKIAEKYLPDIILLDVVLPDIDGFSVCKRLKAAAKTKEIPIIFITAKDNTEDEVYGLKLGAVDYITKPFCKEKVLARVKTQLELNQAKNELKCKNGELEETKKMLNKILNLSIEGIRYVDTDYNVVKSNQKYDQLNRSYLKQKENSLKEDASLKCYESLCSGRCNSKECSLQQIEAGKEMIQHDMKLDLAGQKRYFIVTVVPYKDDTGKIIGFLQSYRDITARKEKELEIEVQNEELERLYENLQDEFEKGIKLHEQFLPDKLPQVEGVSYKTYFQPADKLGGDFYNVIKLKGQLLIYLADVSGHGLDGSMLNIFLRETINNFLLYEHQKGEKLEANRLINFVANKYRQEDFSSDYFICLLVGVLDLKQMKVSFANSGFQFPPVKVNKRGELSVLDCQGMPISSAIKAEEFENDFIRDHEQLELKLKKGDTLLLTTDGLIEEERFNKMYGLERLTDFLSENYLYPVDLINLKLRDDFKSFCDCLTGQDDLTYLILKRDFDLVAEFSKVIESNMEQMYQLQEQVSEFIAPYYEMPSLICVGFQEIVTNAIEHGNQMDSEKKVEVRVEVTTKYIKASIKDQGSGFDWQNKINQRLDIESDFANEEERGRGIKMSNKLYDAIWYNEAGNEAYLFKQR